MTSDTPGTDAEVTPVVVQAVVEPVGTVRFDYGEDAIRTPRGQVLRLSPGPGTSRLLEELRFDQVPSATRMDLCGLLTIEVDVIRIGGLAAARHRIAHVVAHEHHTLSASVAGAHEDFRGLLDLWIKCGFRVVLGPQQEAADALRAGPTGRWALHRLGVKELTVLSHCAVHFGAATPAFALFDPVRGGGDFASGMGSWLAINARRDGVPSDCLERLHRAPILYDEYLRDAILAGPTLVV